MTVAKPKYDFPAYFGFDFDGKMMKHFILAPTLDELHKDLEEMADDEEVSLSPAEEKKSEDKPSKFFDDIKGFVEGMNSVYHVIYITAAIGNAIVNSYAKNNIVKFVEKNCKKIDNVNEFVIYGVPDLYLHDLNRAVKEFKDMDVGVDSLPSSVIMGLVARFDASLSRLIRTLFEFAPGSMGGKDKSISVEDIMRFQSMEELHGYLIDSEIYKIMHGSHDDQVSFIEVKFDIKIRDFYEKYGDFIEVFERRNLVAHGEGVVTDRYCARIEAFDVSEDSRLALGSSVDLSISYLQRATDTLYEFGFLLIWWSWLKFHKKEKNIAYDVAISATYDLIIEERYSLASRIIKSVLSRKDGEISEISLRMLCINCANCLKNLDDKSWKKELKRFNWDACSDNFKICVSSLNEDVGQVCDIMPRVIDPNLVGKDAFRTWPVFSWVTGDETFRAKFKEVFGEEFDSKSLTDKELEVSALKDAAAKT